MNTDLKAAESEPSGGRRSRAWLLARVSAVALVLALLGLLIWSLVGGSSGANFAKQAGQGKKPPAPAFDLPVLWAKDATWPAALRPRIADGRLNLRELRGQVAVVNFWASWCYPCKQEAPAFRQAAERYRGRVAFVGIDVQDLKSAARGFLRRYRVNYVSLHDAPNNTYTAYGLTGVPETYLLDRRGRTVEHAVGRLDFSDLTKMIEPLLKRR